MPTTVAFGSITWAINASVLSDFEFSVETGNIYQFAVRDGTTGTLHASSIGTLTLNRWYFIVCQWNSSTRQVRCVLDADLTQGFETAMPNVARSLSIQFEAIASSNMWELDEMHFFNELKVDPWIVDQWNDGAGRAFPN